MELSEELENLYLLQIANERLSENEQKTISRESAIEELGIIETDLDNLLPVDLE